MNLPLDNPFVEGDTARDRLEWCVEEIEKLKLVNKLLMEVVMMLAQAEAYRIEKVRKK